MVFLLFKFYQHQIINTNSVKTLTCRNKSDIIYVGLKFKSNVCILLTFFTKETIIIIIVIGVFLRQVLHML